MDSLQIQFCNGLIYDRVVETKRGFSILNHYYEKQNVKPIPMQMVDLKNATVVNQILNICSCQSLDTIWYSGFRDKINSIFLDPYEDHVYYTTVGNTHNNAHAKHYIFGFHEDNGKIDNVFQATIASSICPDKIIDVSPSWIYVTAYHDTTHCCYLYRINKNTGSVEKCIENNVDATRNRLSLIYKDENFLYFVTNCNYDRFFFYRYNKSTDTYTVKDLAAATTSTSNMKARSALLYDNVYTRDNMSYIYYPYYSSGKLTVKYIPFDITKDVSDNEYRKTTAVSSCTTWKGFESEDRGIFRIWTVDDYLYIFFYNDDYNSDFQAVETQCIHAFKINADLSLQYLSSNQIDEISQIISICLSPDMETICVGFHDSFKLMNLNKETMQYELVSNDYITDVNSVGFDEYSRIWVQHLDGSVVIHSLNDPYQSTLAFEKASYIFDGTNINTHLIFEAIDFNGLPAKGYYTFTLEGTAKFADNNLAEIEIYYESGPTTIPIVITGSDQLFCKVHFQRTKETEGVV